MKDNTLTLLKNALLSPHNTPLLSRLRASASAIREALESEELDWSENDTKRLEKEFKWVAEVYDAVAATEVAEVGEDDDLARAIATVRQDKEREIASAFDIALKTLPERFHDWKHWFAVLPETPDDYQRLLRHQAIVIEGGPHAAGLVRYGMTPGTFAEAARGVELLLNHLIRTAGRVEQRAAAPASLASVFEFVRRQQVGFEMSRRRAFVYDRTALHRCRY